MFVQVSIYTDYIYNVCRCDQRCSCATNTSIPSGRYMATRVQSMVRPSCRCAPTDALFVWRAPELHHATLCMSVHCVAERDLHSICFSMVKLLHTPLLLQPPLAQHEPVCCFSWKRKRHGGTGRRQQRSHVRDVQSWLVVVVAWRVAQCLCLMCLCVCMWRGEREREPEADQRGV